MKFGLSEEQTLLTDNVNRFLDERAPLDRIRAFADDGDATDIWQGLHELGLTALLIDEADGGLGMRVIDAALIAESLGRHVTPAPFIGSSVLLPLAIRASNKDHPDLVDALLAGNLRTGVAIGEAIAKRADAGIAGNGNTLTGKALYAVDAPADGYLVGDDAQRLYFVAADVSGLDCRTLTTVDATRPTAELVFNDTPATLLTNDPRSFAHIVAAAHTMIAADTLGAAQHMVDDAVEYAKERKQFNRAIATFQAVKHMCAEMAAHLEPCRAFVWYAAHAVDALPDDAPLTACHAKAHLAEVGRFVAKTATEVHGGMGFTDLLGLHYWFKRIGFNRQIWGTPEVLRAEAARLQNLNAA